MSTRDSSGVLSFNTDENGLIVVGYFSGAVPSDANKFAAGCLLIGSDGVLYSNAGSSASPSFQNINSVQTSEIANGAITGAKLSPGMGYFCAAVGTNGTTPVNVFGAGGAPVALTITSMMTLSQDTTAATITLKRNSDTIGTVAKGTTSGDTLATTSVSNNTVALADAVTVVSSSAGNATALIVFTVA